MDESAGGLPLKFDASSPAVKANPYPTYTRLRAAGPVCRGGPGQWVVTRYTDVAALLADRRLGNHFPAEYHKLSAGDGPAAEFLQRIILYQDRPEHTCIRRAMARAFTPSALGRLRGRIHQLVELLLAPASDTGLLEAVGDLALPLPVTVVCEIMGIPPQHQAEIRPVAINLGKVFVPGAGSKERDAADAAVLWLRRYVSDLLAERRRVPRDDFFSRVLAEEDVGGVGQEELVDNAVFLFFAGFETTTSLIATGCAALLEHPDQLALLRNTPSLIPTAVEEFLRFDAPIQSRLRLVREPVEIGGRVIKPGRLLLLLVGSANHDESQFSRPGELDVTRTPNPHLSFGGGDHHCLGASLARIEGAIVFQHLLRAFKQVEPAGEAVRDVDSPLRTYERVPIAVRAA